MSGANGDRPDWERFVTEIARLAAVPPAEVTPASRLSADLGCDSIALAELALVLINDYGMASVAEPLGEMTWDDVTVGQLYEEYCSGGARGPG